MSRDGVMRGQIGLGFGFDLPVYKRLAAALAERGYAVYRYDKRTCGSFNDCAETDHSAIPYSLIEVEFATTEYVGDAEAAMDAVTSHPAIDPDRTFFVGHSEGGELIPVLLSQRPAVRAGVMLAPPFHTMAVVLEQQSERVRWSFTSAGQPDRAELEGNQLLDAARALRRIEQGTHLGQPVLGQPPGLWASWLDLANRAPDLARRLDRPLLILGGSYDYNVIPSEIESWARWLGEGARAPHRVQLLDCVTHALNCIAQPDPTRITPSDIGRDLSPELLREIVGFLDARARPPRGGSARPAARPPG
jgi:alpha-beta hydrolase superfamily lysophospholipase